MEAGRQAENDREAREALWQKLQEANQKLSDASRNALGREAELEQRLGMAAYGQQMAEVQSSELHARLQQRSSMLQVRPLALFSQLCLPLLPNSSFCMSGSLCPCIHVLFAAILRSPVQRTPANRSDAYFLKGCYLCNLVP